MNAIVPRLRLRKLGFALLLLLSSGFLYHTAQGQAAPAATRGFDLDLFGGATEFKPDYGNGYNLYNTGFVFGGDVIRSTRFFEIAIEPRFGRTSAKLQGDIQSYFLGDVVLSKRIRRFHPYGVGGIGYGTISYNGHGDNSVVYTFGPGLQYDATSHWSVKGDWQYQFWNVGTEVNPFNPHGFTAAVVYRLHFGSF
jgi:opacity protein-like surface antigen